MNALPLFCDKKQNRLHSLIYLPKNVFKKTKTSDAAQNLVKTHLFLHLGWNQESVFFLLNVNTTLNNILFPVGTEEVKDGEDLCVKLMWSDSLLTLLTAEFGISGVWIAPPAEPWLFNHQTNPPNQTSSRSGGKAVPHRDERWSVHPHGPHHPTCQPRLL